MLSLLQELLDAFRKALVRSLPQGSGKKPTETQTRDFLKQLLEKHVSPADRGAGATCPTTGS